MGTRSLIHFNDGEQTLCTIYRQFDGYPTGRGLELAEWLAGIRVVNGIRLGDTNIANGCGCLAAQWIAKEKAGAGGVYIYPPNTKDCWEEYTYTVTVTCEGDEHAISLACPEADFSGTPAEFVALFSNVEAA